jgi:exopolyphosphatase/guanosine-5'-triphosphate,3'-diphosphate pyrophosphatase
MGFSGEKRGGIAGTLAAVDLGSSSFRLLRGQWQQGRFRETCDRSRHVGLARCVDAAGQVTPAGREQVAAALAKLRPYVADLPPARVAVAGTASLRGLDDGAGFCRFVEQELGFPVRVIDGAEEARLTFAGVVGGTAAAAPQGRHRVLDLGGASTELAEGAGGWPERTLSVPLGCATLGSLAPAAGGDLEALRRQVQQRLPEELSAFRAAGGGELLAAPGIVGSMARLAGTPGRLDAAGLRRLGQLLTARGGAPPLPDGVPAHHAALLPGAWAILGVLMEALAASAVIEAGAGLRHGLVQELIRRWPAAG